MIHVLCKNKGMLLTKEKKPNINITIFKFLEFLKNLKILKDKVLRSINALQHLQNINNNILKFQSFHHITGNFY